MSGFEPGEGWREVTAQGYVEASATTITLREDGRPDRWWVREEPAPALPTEPYTVIRVTFRPRWIFDAVDFVYWGERGWESCDSLLGPTELAKRITGFEVLAEPHAVTAKAVLDRARSMPLRYRPIDVVNELANEFEVES